MRRIFICYRRDDSEGYALSIRRSLVAHFGPEAIFQDITSIPPGKNVRTYINDAVKSCKVMLVLIGKQWLRMTDEETGQRRLDQPRDFVRLEIAAALEHGLTVIPVLLRGTPMPYAHDLPEALRMLVVFNAHSISAITFDADMQRLDDWLEIEEGIEPLTETSVEAVTQKVLDVLPPPFEWIEIPAGRVTLGEDMGTHDVERFMIAKYPVTNAQFQVFADATDGYGEPGWWDFSGEAQAWRTENTEPQAPAWDGLGDHPRVNVTWFEAVAFCRWLGSRVGSDVRLPTETEWQRAAQGDDGRTYPWGNEETGYHRANWNRLIGKTTPVGNYPDGASPYDVLDMAGNVWEWCATDYDTGSHDIGQPARRRVLRGGSWNNLFVEYLRTDDRYGPVPVEWNDGVGFRCARSF